MLFASVRELKLETNKVLGLSKKNGPVVVTRRGQPILLLRAITKDDFAFKVKSLWNRVKSAAVRAGYGPEDVEKLIKETRRSK